MNSQQRAIYIFLKRPWHKLMILQTSEGGSQQFYATWIEEEHIVAASNVSGDRGQRKTGWNVLCRLASSHKKIPAHEFVHFARKRKQWRSMVTQTWTLDCAKTLKTAVRLLVLEIGNTFPCFTFYSFASWVMFTKIIADNDVSAWWYLLWKC